MDHTRHIGLFNARDLSVALIGAGGIGAITALTLAKMGVGSLTVFDDDTVRDVNLPTQFFPLYGEGLAKTVVLRDMVLLFSDDTAYRSLPERVVPATPPELLRASLVISAVDSIHARQAIWPLVKATRPAWYLDARMGAETFMLYSVSRARWPAYESALMAQDESRVPDEPCTMKATIYTGAMAAGHIGAAVRRVAVGEAPPFLLVHDIYRSVLTVIP